MFFKAKMKQSTVLNSMNTEENFKLWQLIGLTYLLGILF
jgi:hypothetical protein